MRRYLSIFVVACVVACCLSALPLSAEEVHFERQIAPLLEKHCIRCHSSNNRKGELSLETTADLLAKSYLTPGDPTSSYVLDLISPQDGKPPSMPKDSPELSESERTLFRTWIEQGATWPEGFQVKERSRANQDWWSLRQLKIEKPSPLADAPTGWNASTIDRFILQALREKGLNPNPLATPHDLIYRVTYDLTGLPPTPEETEAFIADPSDAAYEKLVDRLLSSPRYGEQWGRHWLDVIRFGESRGFERNEIITNLWPLRDYVIRCCNEDRPFNEVIREHLAGDVIAKDLPEREIAAAFLVAGPYDDVGNQDPVQAAQIRANTVDEMISATSEAFLGLTVGCARCHDHKFDPILQRDYYSLYATFAGVHHGAREIATAEQREQRQQAIKDLNSNRDQQAKLLSDLRKAIAARARDRSAEHAAHWTRPAIARRETVEEFPPVQALVVKLVVEGQESNPASTSNYRIDEFEVWSAESEPRNVALSANGAVASGVNRTAGDVKDAYGPQLTIDGQFGARWIAQGPELTIRLSQPQTINRIVFSSDRPGQAPTTGDANFVSEYRILVSTDGENWQEVANSHDRQPVNDAHRDHRLFQAEINSEETRELQEIQQRINELNGKINAVPGLPIWWAGNFRPTPGPFHLFLGGSPERKGDAVLASSLSFLGKVTPTYELQNDQPEAQRRLTFADWVVHPDNPLTPRVLANRLWHYHFGTGIVETPSDFGYMGGQPSHPALLDWLAGQLQQHNWQLKPLHRQIVLSQTYRQASTYHEEAAHIDADSRLLWRYPPRRLTSEEIRDTILLICGKLDERQGGPGFRLYQYLQDNVATYIPLDVHGPDTYRRAIYHHNARASRIDLMSDFDGPDCAFSAPRRAETTTPLQALTMLNHQFTLDMAKALSERLQREAGEKPDDQVRRAFAVCYGRPPTEDEFRHCTEFVSKYDLPAFCRILLNTSELISLK